MLHLFRLPAIHIRHQRLALALLCLLPMQPVVADEFFPADDGSLYSRAIASGPSAASEDTQSMPGDTPPDLRRRNTLIIATGASLVAAYGLSNWWQYGLSSDFRTTNEGWFARFFW